MEDNKAFQLSILALGSLGFASSLYLRYISQQKHQKEELKKQRKESASLVQFYEDTRAPEKFHPALQVPPWVTNPNQPLIPNPINHSSTERGFLPDIFFDRCEKSSVLQTPIVQQNDPNMENVARFMPGGPRRSIVMPPSEVKAAIVTCGGLCPGLNVVIREIVMTFHYNYGVDQVYGIMDGFKGFYKPGRIKQLKPDDVTEIHTMGGTVLRSSRGGFDLRRICDSIEANGFNHLYIIGGDGTHRGIAAMIEEFDKRGRVMYIAGIPKTIDNDIPIIDTSFGFDTSVSEAIKAIDSANVEATSVEYGIGLVKLMGRNCGYIALHASLSNLDVNLCLIPESPYRLNGPGGVYEYVLNRIKKKQHCVIVVAEGAASGCTDEKLEREGTDPSGNPLLFDIGNYLKHNIVKYCQSNGINATLKYIDPTYMIRTVAANSSDKFKCTILAQTAVFAAMSGYTAFSAGIVSNTPTIIPVSYINSYNSGTGAPPGQRRINIDTEFYWWRLVASTGQPAFK